MYSMHIIQLLSTLVPGGEEQMHGDSAARRSATRALHFVACLLPCVWV
jgi:hypothetical protein